MDLTRLKKRNWIYIALAFAFPCVGMLFVMLISGYTPFGEYSMLYSDMYHQYYPFFVAFRKALLSGDSLLYSWSVGLGMDYVGLISYYLASPLNLLSVLVPESILLPYFSFLVPIKLGLAGMFFAIFLKKVFSREDLATSLFGSFYGLCAWALGYQWNVMWLDTFALLPLVVLGMVALLKERKFILYTFTLFLSIVANYYIGLFVCIFILLIFFCYQICRWQGFKKFFADLMLMGIFSLLAIGMTAFLQLPTLAALQTTQSSVNEFPEGFKLNIASENTWKGLLIAMVKVAGNMNGGLEPTFKEGLPNLYCGVITNLLAFLFLTCPGVKIKENLCCIFLLLFFNVSFIIRQLDYIWHGFHFTNMIPYRFSFLYSFVMLYMAYRAYLLRSQFQLWQISVAALLCVTLILCNEDLSSTVLWAYNAGFLLFYVATLVYSVFRKPFPANATWEQKKICALAMRSRKQTSAVMLCAFMAIELITTLVSFGLWFPGTYVANYPKGTTDTKKVISYMQAQEKDTLFYRAETTHSQTLNDGAINNYYGVSAFTSSANVKTTEFMKALGYGAKNTYNRYCFEESSPVANLFLGLKYMIERDGKVEENAYFDDVYQSGNVHLLENNAYLPLAFLANSELSDVDFSDINNRFIFQNTLFSAATGINDTIWDILGYGCCSVHSEDVTIKTQANYNFCSYSGGDEEGTLIYRYLSDRTGLMCVDLDLSKRNDFTVYKNGEELYSESHSLPQMLSICDVDPGDVVEIHFECKANEEGKIDVSAAVLNESVFRAGYEILNVSTLNLTHFENTYVEGVIHCDRDGLLYASIPQNGNWSVTVDAEPVDIQLVGDVMLGVPLTAGEHTVAFQYQNAAFSIGWKVSLICLIVVFNMITIFYKKNAYKGKYSK